MGWMDGWMDGTRSMEWIDFLVGTSACVKSRLWTLSTLSVWVTYCFLHIIVDVAASGGEDVCRCEFCLC